MKNKMIKKVKTFINATSDGLENNNLNKWIYIKIWTFMLKKTKQKKTTYRAEVNEIFSEFTLRNQTQWAIHKNLKINKNKSESTTIYNYWLAFS